VRTDLFSFEFGQGAWEKQMEGAGNEILVMATVTIMLPKSVKNVTYAKAAGT
jgi:hypothetical protein